MRSPSNERFKLVEEVVNDYVPEIVSSLKSNPVAGETLKEICNLLVDITEISNMEIPRNYSAEEVMRFCMPSTLITIVRPALDHLFAAYVFGAYPLCYQPIRISVEAISYSLSVDIKKTITAGTIHSEKVREFQKCLDEIGDGDFLEKLLRLQASMDKIQFRPAKLIHDWLPEIVGKELAKRLMEVWSKTSNDFLHFKGYLHKAGSKKWDSSNPPPSYMIGAFVEYDTSDEPFLEELKNTIKEFRGLLKELLEWFRSLVPLAKIWVEVGPFRRAIKELSDKLYSVSLPLLLVFCVSCFEKFLKRLWLLKFGSIDEDMWRIFSDPKELAKEIKRRRGVEIGESTFKARAVVAKRNIILHNGGVVDDKALQAFMEAGERNFQRGQRLRLSTEEVKRDLEKLLEFAEKVKETLNRL